MNLFIDTANEESVVALISDDGTIFAKEHWLSKNNQSEELLIKIEALLGAKKSSLKGIIVNSGPGSYTGLRIGLATANSMAFGLNIPIYKFNLPLKDINKFAPGLLGENFCDFVLPIYKNSPFITKEKPRL